VTTQRGGWQNTITYRLGEGVEYNGAQYVCMVNTSIGTAPSPTATSPWAPVDAERVVPQDAWLVNAGYDPTAPQLPVTSYFGWTDPTFDPEHPFDPEIQTGGNGVLDRPDEASDPNIEWPWPKMIRITLSLADPADPSVEQTFQFVFDVPAAHEGR
jgi:hypothetical protein